MGRRTQNKDERISMAPIIFASAIIPLIVYMKRIKLDGILYSTWNGANDIGEFFSYYKSIAVVVIASVALLILVLDHKNLQIRNIKKQLDFLPVVIYISLVIISTLFSEYVSVALYGYTERYEGALVLISYIVICFYTASYIKTEEQVRKIFIIIGISCTIIGIIGVTQYFGNDILQTTLGKKIILPKQYHQFAEDIKFSHDGNIISATLSNPNYVGSYSCMLLFITLGLFYYIKDTKRRILTGAVFCGFAFVLWIGSMSRAGLVGGMIGFLCFIVLQGRNIISNWKYSVGVVIYFIFLYFTMNTFSGGRIVSEFNNINPIKENTRIEQSVNELYIKELKSEKDEVVIKTNNESLRIIYNNGKIEFFDEYNTPVDSIYENYTYSFNNDNYNKYKLKVVSDGEDYILHIGNHKIKLNYSDEGFHYVTVTGQKMKFGSAEKLSLLDGKEAFASGRGFIWSRTVPMIKNTIIKGYGPDTYVIYFPQWDLAGKINGLGNPATIVDKPHNWYMQMAVNTGLLSLISVIIFILIYIYKALSVYIRSKNKNNCIIQSAIFSAVISYCIAGLFNDSVVSVAPVFWVILGAGIADNRILEKLNYKK